MGRRSLHSSHVRIVGKKQRLINLVSILLELIIEFQPKKKITNVQGAKIEKLLKSE